MHRVHLSYYLFLSVTFWLAAGPWTPAVYALPQQTCRLVPSEAASSAEPSATATPSGGTSDAPPEDVVAAAWYAGWTKGTFPPSSIPWDKYNMLTFAFALTTEDSSTLSLNQEEATLKSFVDEAHNHDVKALLSLGGWTGSQYFSTAVATAENRTAFTKAITDMATTYSLDGIDFDWEYPNADGIGCNTKSPEDAANFLLLLQELKKDPVGSKLILTAAVSLKPFMGADSTPMTDVSGFADVLDHLAIMGYDVWGSWSTSVGPNAPLRDSCATTKVGSVESAVDAWTAAKFPASKIVVGVAAYGRSFRVESGAVLDSEGRITTFSPPFDKSQPPLGEGEVSGAASTTICGVSEPPSGIYTFNGLIASGFLNSTGSPAPGISSAFDDCSQTPFLYKKGDQMMVSFDNAESFAAKGTFINDKGLAGFAVWHVGGDSPTNTLLDSIHDAMGIETDCPAEGSEDQ